MRGCISERRRIKSDGKSKKFSVANGNCSWQLNKRHLFQLFAKYYLKRAWKDTLLFAYCVLKGMDFELDMKILAQISCCNGVTKRAFYSSLK
jgi:hypothetical protein